MHSHSRCSGAGGGSGARHPTAGLMHAGLVKRGRCMQGCFRGGRCMQVDCGLSACSTLDNVARSNHRQQGIGTKPLQPAPDNATRIACAPVHPPSLVRPVLNRDLRVLALSPTLNPKPTHACHILECVLVCMHTHINVHMSTCQDMPPPSATGSCTFSLAAGVTAYKHSPITHTRSAHAP